MRARNTISSQGFECAASEARSSTARSRVHSDAHPAEQRRRLLRAGAGRARRGAEDPGRDHRGGARNATAAAPAIRSRWTARCTVRRAANGFLLRERHADRLRASRRHGAARPACRTWWSRASITARTWATTPSIRAPSRRRPKGSCWAFPRSRCRLSGRSGDHFATAAQGRGAISCERHQRRRPTEAYLLNVNVPDVPARSRRRHRGHEAGQAPQGRAGDQGRQRRAAIRCTGSAPRAMRRTPGQGTDFHAVASGRVSVTPLQMDLTHFSHLESVRAWISD